MSTGTLMLSELSGRTASISGNHPKVVMVITSDSSFTSNENDSRVIKHPSKRNIDKYRTPKMVKNRK